MRHRHFAFLIFVTLLSACASTSNVRLRDVAGTWYGTSQQHGGLIHGLAELHADGSFTLRTFDEKACRLVPATVMVGRWAISNGLYARLTTEVNGKSVDPNDRVYRDVYRIEELGADRIVYTSGAPVIKFTDRRVAEEFVAQPVHPCVSSAQGSGAP